MKLLRVQNIDHCIPSPWHLQQQRTNGSRTQRLTHQGGRVFTALRGGENSLSEILSSTRRCVCYYYYCGVCVCSPSFLPCSPRTYDTYVPTARSRSLRTLGARQLMYLRVCIQYVGGGGGGRMRTHTFVVEFCVSLTYSRIPTDRSMSMILTHSDAR
jgi:hypothetical protein